MKSMSRKWKVKSFEDYNAFLRWSENKNIQWQRIFINNRNYSIEYRYVNVIQFHEI